MAATPLMPKATAVWLVDNTSLSFEQIAEFCGLHLLEVKGIADGDVAQGIRGKNPVTAGELTREEIAKGEEDPEYRMKLSVSKVVLPEIKTKKRPRYTPVSRRQDRPNAVVWLLRNHAELKDSQIIRLVGTTKPTIEAIRERTHWNAPNLTPIDPVTLGLCTQLDLDMEVGKAAKTAPPRLEDEGARLLPAGETTEGADPMEPQPEPVGDAGVLPGDQASPASPEDLEFDPDSVFAKLKSLKSEDL